MKGRPKQWKETRKNSLKEKAKKYSLNPIAMTIFGVVLNYDKMGLITRKTVGQLWRKFEEAGFEKKDGVYDTRDWEAIRTWTKKLVYKALAIKQLDS